MPRRGLRSWIVHAVILLIVRQRRVGIGHSHDDHLMHEGFESLDTSKTTGPALTVCVSVLIIMPLIEVLVEGSMRSTCTTLRDTGSRWQSRSTLEASEPKSELSLSTSSPSPINRSHFLCANCAKMMRRVLPFCNLSAFSLASQKRRVDVFPPVCVRAADHSGSRARPLRAEHGAIGVAGKARLPARSRRSRSRSERKSSASTPAGETFEANSCAASS